jgi:PAS domain S-box-containing protein
MPDKNLLQDEHGKDINPTATGRVEVLESRLAETTVILQSMMESHKDVLIFSIDRDYRYLSFNKAFKKATFGAYGTEVSTMGSLLESITRVEDREKVKFNCDRALAGESHLTIEEYGEVKRYYFETRYNPLYNNKGEIIGVTVLSSNVTDRKVSEKKIQDLNKELEAFTYSVAHDLRAPLRIMGGYSQVLKEDYEGSLDEEGKRLLNVIASNCKSMGQLIDHLLEFSRLGRAALEAHLQDMDVLITTVLDEHLKHVDKNRIEIRKGVLDAAKCDRQLMQQVFTNLISNAIKYSSKKEKTIIEIGSTKNDNSVTYFIRDNGSGFDMKYVDKLFGVFQRLHKESEFEGSGVGLAIVDRIITKHGGTVWAEGEVGKGATFYVQLPQ